MIRGIAQRWRQLSGSNNWVNLLDPLDKDLRQYIIHYGAMAQATYDTFNYNTQSKYCGSSIYARKNLFQNVGLAKGNPYRYRAIKYLYATSQLKLPPPFLIKSDEEDCYMKDSNWIGYVAVATDQGKVALGRRDILVAWRGSVSLMEYMGDLDFPLDSASEIFGKDTTARVHRGFLSMYTSRDPKSPFNKLSARDQVIPVIQDLVKQYKDEEISITITGHSLGAALGLLNAVDIVTNQFNKVQLQKSNSCPVTAFLFASPKIGNRGFQNLYHNNKDVRVLRIRNVPDTVPILPPFLEFVNVGEQLTIDSRKSTYLRDNSTPESWHELESAYLHTLAGALGTDGKFHLEVKRDIALINKASNYLKSEYRIPPFWWVQKNKGMVQRKSGSWKLQDHEK